jgi:hypothetical protein
MIRSGSVQLDPVWVGRVRLAGLSFNQESLNSIKVKGRSGDSTGKSLRENFL